MAAPARLNLLDIRSILLITAVVLCGSILVVGLVLGFEIQTLRQAQTETQLQTLIKARFSDLEKGEFRNFIEGIGRQFPFVALSIKSKDGQSFEYGKRSLTDTCAEDSVSLWQRNVAIEFCQHSRSVWSPIIALVVILIVLLTVAFRGIRIIEQSAIRRLHQTFQGLGIPISSSKGFQGLVKEIEHLSIRVEQALKAEQEATIHRTIALTTQMFAHDVRKPFRQAKAFLNKLSTEDLPQSLQSYVKDSREIISRNLDRVDGMANDLLGFSSTDPQQQEPVALRQLLTEIIKEWQTSEKRDLPTIKLVSNHQFKPMGSERRLHRVLTNIISNAIEATKAHDNLSIQTRQTEGWTEIAIHNTGSFIEQKLLPHIFEPFTTSGKSHGTGLGLMIVKQLVSGMEGQIDCASSEESGTVFTVRLLASEISDVPSPINSALQTPVILLENPLHIAVIDDDLFLVEEWLSLRRDSLEIHGYGSPEDFLQARSLEQINQLDAVICDYHFGSESRYNGLDFLAMLRDKNKILALFLATDDQSVRRSFLHLPKDPQQALSSLLRHLGTEDRC